MRKTPASEPRRPSRHLRARRLRRTAMHSRRARWLFMPHFAVVFEPARCRGDAKHSGPMIEPEIGEVLRERAGEHQAAKEGFYVRKPRLL
jgi:hypothetical protein